MRDKRRRFSVHVEISGKSSLGFPALPRKFYGYAQSVFFFVIYVAVMFSF